MSSTIPEQIRKLREQTELSQVAFTHAFNAALPLEVTMSPSDLCKYENGVNQMPLEKFMKMQEMASKKK